MEEEIIAPKFQSNALKVCTIKCKAVQVVISYLMLHSFKLIMHHVVGKFKHQKHSSFRLELKLQDSQTEFEESCYQRYREEGLQPVYDNIPWTDIVLECINYRLRTMDWVDHTVTTDQVLDVIIKLLFFPSYPSNLPISG